MKNYFLICIFFPLLLRSQSDTFAFIGKGIDTSLLKLGSKSEWFYKGLKCTGPLAIYHEVGSDAKRLDRVIWFSKGKIDSVVIYSFCFFSLTPTILSIESKIKIDTKRNRRYWLVFQSEDVPWLSYQYKIINNFYLSSSKRIIYIEKDIKFVEDGCQFNYHSNGKIKDAGCYCMGNKEGMWKYYNDIGELEKTEIYKENILISKDDKKH